MPAKAPIYCQGCGLQVFDAQRSFERIEGGYVPLRSQGGANTVTHYRRTGEVFHELCLVDRLRGEQLTMFEDEDA